MADSTPHTDTDSMGSKDWRSCLCKQAAVSHCSSLLASRLLGVSTGQLREKNRGIRRGAEGSMPTADLIASVTVIVAIGDFGARVMKGEVEVEGGAC